MVKIHIAEKKNPEPWNIPFSQRCLQLKRSISGGYRPVLLLYERADTSTFRYRAYNVAQASEKSAGYRCVYFFENELDRLEPYLHDIALAVVIRMKWSLGLEKFISKVKLRQIPLLFDVDDLVFDTQYLPVVANTLNISFRSEADYDFWFAYIGRIEHTAQRADGFVTTNSFLGERLQEKFQKPYAIIPNFLNAEQLSFSEKCLKAKRAGRFRKPFTIGYFSGTPSHINDFKTVYRELMSLLEEFPEMLLEVVGFMEFPQEMQPLIRAGRVTFTPLVDFLELQRLVTEVDINIVPLVDNVFTNCKSELKFFEAAVVDTPTFAQPTFTYKNCIVDGVNGFLCRQGEWYEKIKAFYLEKTNFSAIVKNARHDAMEHYQGNEILQKIEQCYDLFAK